MPYVAKISALWEDPKTGTVLKAYALALCVTDEGELGAGKRWISGELRAC